MWPPAKATSMDAREIRGVDLTDPPCTSQALSPTHHFSIISSRSSQSGARQHAGDGPPTTHSPLPYTTSSVRRTEEAPDPTFTKTIMYNIV